MNDEPRLPLDLERDIFILAVTIYPKTRPHLLLVARRVFEWIGPLRYKFLRIDEDPWNSKGRFVQSSLDFTNEDFPIARILASGARHLVVDRTNDWASADKLEESRRLLRLCTNTTHLAALGPVVSSALLPILESMPNLRVVALHLDHLFDGISSIYLQHLALRNITHLDIFDSLDNTEGDPMRKILSVQLPQLAALTHLSLRVMRPVPWSMVEELLRDCKQLRLLLLLWLPPSETGRVHAQQTPIRDGRLVMTSFRRWGEAAGDFDLPPFWKLADDFVQNKRAGNVPATDFWMER
ncbi:hypothetical protein C8F01DRAFT_1157800 [Mycena amicta]|nr:hypothetical protein C8F01DRAFT_1157800 [Mycena amicta]